MSGFHLDSKTFRPPFPKMDNVTDDGVVTMKMMTTGDHHLQSNRRILLVFTELDKATARQRWDPGNIDISSAYSELQERSNFVFENHRGRTTYNMHIAS
jgi:CobQ-like glutamine amidotransferase family enzyme